jgi:hypothetical protein
MSLDFVAEELIEAELGVVQGVHLQAIGVLFQLVGTGEPRPKPTFTLRSNCDPPPPPHDCPDVWTRTLTLKVVNLSHTYDTADAADRTALEAICNTQLDRVCEVWRNRATLDLNVQSVIEQPDADADGDNPLKKAYCNCSHGEEGSIHTIGFASDEHIEIYLVDALTARTGGGIAHDCNEASAYCILEVGRMATNDYLLAHELCHVVGLGHPDGTAGIPGSPNSIAEPGAYNPSRHTLYNMRIFTDPSFPLNPKVLDTSLPDCFRPD